MGASRQSVEERGQVVEQPPADYKAFMPGTKFFDLKENLNAFEKRDDVTLAECLDMAGDKTAGAFMTGFFPIMMFALPAAALAIISWRMPIWADMTAPACAAISARATRQRSRSVPSLATVTSTAQPP